MKRILVISATGMGDGLWGTPALRALKKSYPESRIHLLINSRWAQLLEGNPNIDRIIKYNPQWYKQSLTSLRLLRYKFDCVLIFHANKDVARLLPWLRRRSLLAHQNAPWIPEKNRVEIDGLAHAIQRRLILISKIGANADGGQMEIFFNDQDKAENLKFMNRNKICPKEFIYLNVGAAVPCRRWESKRFTALAHKIFEATPYKVVLGGGPEEKPLIESMKTHLDPKRTTDTYDRSIRANAALIGESRLLVTADTGPMHIGFALKVPTIALFGSIDPMGSGPFEIKNDLYQLIRLDLNSSSPMKQSNRGPDRFKSITVPMVWDKVQEALKK